MCEAQLRPAAAGHQACAEQQGPREASAEDTNQDTAQNAAEILERAGDFSCDNGVEEEKGVDTTPAKIAKCSDNFPSEGGLRQEDRHCANHSQTETQKEKKYNFVDDAEEADKDNSNTVTPIKSWLKKHLDSVKIPESMGRDQQKSRPLYIIPQEPEERVLSSEASSSSEDEDSWRRQKKSPRRRGRPSVTQKEEITEEHKRKGNYDTKLSTDSIGGIKLRFTKNAHEAEFAARTVDPNTGYSYDPDAVKPRGRPKGSKNRPKHSYNQITTPKKIVLQKAGAPQAPNKVAPAKQTTPSPPTTVSPGSSLTFGLASALGPALDDLSRPKSSSPEARVRRLSESSSNGGGSESDASKDDDIEVVETVNIASAASPVHKVIRNSFEEAFVKSLDSRDDGVEAVAEDNEPILELCPEKMQGLDVDDIIDGESEEEEIKLHDEAESVNDEDERVCMTSRDQSPEEQEHHMPKASSLVLQDTRRSISSERSTGWQDDRAQSGSRSPSPTRTSSPVGSPVARSPFKERSPSPRKSSGSSSSSSSSSDSSSDESRSSSPDIPAQLPIPKLKIKLTSLPSQPSKSYRPVKIFTDPPRHTARKRTTKNNSLAKTLRSLNCKIDIPRLKFRNRSPNSEDEAEFRLHRLDIETLAGCRTDKKSPMTKYKSEAQPPIAPIKIRLRSPSESVTPPSGQCLSTILAQIVRRPRLKATVSSRSYSDFCLPDSPENMAKDVVFNSSLTKSMAVLAKFSDNEICHDILKDIVSEIAEGRTVCEDIIGELVRSLILSEASHSKYDKESVNSHQDPESCDQDKIQNIEFDKRVEKVSEMDEDSSIELSDSEFDLSESLEAPTASNESMVVTEVLCDPSDILESEDSRDAMVDEVQDEPLTTVKVETVPTLRIKKPCMEEVQEEPLNTVKLETVPKLRIKKPYMEEVQEQSLLTAQVETVPALKIKKPCMEEVQQPHSTAIIETVPTLKIKIPCLEEIQEPHSTSLIESVPTLRIKKSSCIDQETKKPIKLVIKPIKLSSVETIDNDVDLSSCISDNEGESKNPPIIVKIPKASLSPTKKSPKSPHKSPLSGFKLSKASFSKTPAVAIKNLKILPIFQPKKPKTLKKKSEESNKTARKISDVKKVEKSASNGETKRTEKSLKPEKKECRFEKKSIKSAFTVTSGKNKESKVTVLKMSDVVTMSRKEEALEKSECLSDLSDLERMLEEERTRKAEDAKKLRETKTETPEKTTDFIAKKSPVKTAAKINNIIKPQEPEPSESPSKMTQKERRSSLSKTREQWVVTPRLKTPSPTPMPFVAKKSKPEETVSFSLPAGGFKHDSKVEPKAKSLPWFSKVDDLFSQYYPDVDKNKEAETTFNENEHSTNNIEENDPEASMYSCVLVQSLLEDLLENLLCELETRPKSSVRSRDCSGDSNRSEASSSSSLERSTSQNMKSRRKTEDLGKFTNSAVFVILV